MNLVPGLYDALVTSGLREQIAGAEGRGLRPELGQVDDAELAELLGHHLGVVLTHHLGTVRAPEDRLRLANELVRAIDALAGDVVVEPAQLLRGIAADAPTARLSLAHPEIPLRQSDLLVNGRGAPSLARSLQTEISSADRIDAVLAFIKWSGLRNVLNELKAAIDRGATVRVLTTTYLGSTERRALDRLVEIGAQVAVSYDTRSTRLHAKAWLFTRNTGYHTAYVGSSNLSIAAMVDGQEWNVRLSGVETAHLVEKFRATIESYWADRFHGFEPYEPGRDGHRFDAAIRDAGGMSSDRGAIVPAFEIHPYTFQQEILDRLDVERAVHGRWRNLVVAATGTGKTVMAALDYKRLRRDPGLGLDPSLLFVAHRKEILEQSRRRFAGVLGDGSFGELWVAGSRPQRWRHVFASVQTLAQQGVDRLAPDAYDVVIVDEFHHAEAATYTRLLRHLRPRVLVGLTATPERADGRDVAHWFDGHVAAELRLWEALERDLLCPFHYYGVHDLTDLDAITWRGGGYDQVELDNLVTGNDVRARIALNAVTDKVSNPHQMRALGFCVSKAHAAFMAGYFTDSGLPAVAVDADTRPADRDDALRALRSGTITTLFAVDLFNEGVDLPEVDTILMLRPTESATVFLQQFGRGLRRAEGKDVLTVIDLVGHQHRKFRFDLRYRALTGVSRTGLEPAVEHGFPYLPPGCHIELDRESRAAVLRNLREQLAPTMNALALDIASYGNPSLQRYLADSGRDLTDLYSGSGSSKRSWTTLRRRAGLPVAAAGPEEEALLRRVGALLSVDDPERARAYRRLLRADGPRIAELNGRELRFAAMLVFTFWPDGGRLASYDDGLDRLRAHSAVCAEATDLLELAEDRVAHVPIPLPAASWADVPLLIHARYAREEMLAGLGAVSITGPKPSVDRSGVRWVEAINADVLNVTIQKAERDYSPTTMYQDYAMSPSLFHWESQSTTGVDSPTGQRYVNHRERGTHVLLFVRETKANDTGATPYMFLGPVRYMSHERSRPISLIWALDHEMPADFYHGVSLLSA